jgi:hypothetical protein
MVLPVYRDTARLFHNRDDREQFAIRIELLDAVIAKIGDEYLVSVADGDADGDIELTVGLAALAPLRKEPAGREVVVPRLQIQFSHPQKWRAARAKEGSPTEHHVIVRLRFLFAQLRLPFRQKGLRRLA